jgi:hypothetical protein
MPDRYFFLHVLTANSWPVDDPAAWLLEHARDPLLGRARDRLTTLDPGDGDRIVRLVTRRCGLALIDLASADSVVVQHWGQPAPDLRPFIKLHGLARPQVQVALVNRKNESVTLQPGSAFLYGEPVEGRFPWHRFESKWQLRLVQEDDDWAVAPSTWNTLSWERAGGERMIPWVALKSVWRRDQAPPCPNCDVPLVALRFLWVLPITFSGILEVTRGCFGCRREFRQDVDGDFWAWLARHLASDLLPTHQYGTRKLDLRPRHPPRPGQG